MKNIFRNNILSLLAACSFLVSSCDEEYEKPAGATEGSDVFISTSFGVGKAIDVHKDLEMYFDDFSSGGMKTNWTFPSAAGPTVESSEDRHVKLSFTNPGTYQATVEIDFGKQYMLDGVLATGNVYNGTIDFNVLDDILANFTAVSVIDGADIPVENNLKYGLNSGDKVQFLDASEGMPDVFTYQVTNTITGRVSNFENQEFQFVELGAYSVEYTPNRQTLSNTYADTLNITELVEVVATTDPVDLVGALPSGEKVTLTYSRPILNADKCKPSAFTLKAFPAEDPTYDMRIKITEVIADENDPTKVILTLSDKLYSSDNLYLSYDNTVGDIQTYDPVKAESFTDHVLKYEAQNILAAEDSKFHWDIEASTNNDWVYQWWGGQWGMYNQNDNVSTTRAFEGNQSLYFDMQAGGAAIAQHQAGWGGDLYTFNVKPGTYKIGMWIYIEELGDNTVGEGIHPSVMLIPNDWSAYPQFELYPDTPTGQWIYRSCLWTRGGTDAADITFMLRPYNASSSVPTKIYLDNIEVVEVSVRPPGEY